MAMKIPMGNPFGVGVTPQSTQNMGLVATPETEHSPDKLAAKIDQVGEQITKSSLAWQQEQNNTRVQMFANDLKELENDLEMNPETGFTRLQGRNATERPSGKDLSSEVLDALDSRSKVLMDNMSPIARKAAQQILDATRNSLQLKVNKHLIEQAAVVKQHENTRTLNTAAINAQSEDEQTRNSGLYVARAMTEEMAREKGVWPPDYSKTLGVIHGTRIETLVDDSRIDEAKAWLKQNKHEMSADQYKAAKELIDKGYTTKHAGDLASKIIASGKSDAEMLRDVESVDPKYRKQVRSAVQTHITTQEAINRQEVQDLVTDAWGLAVNGGDIPLSMRADLEAKAPQKLASINRYIEAQKHGKQIKTDRGTWNFLWNMAQNEPEKFARINLQEYMGDLSTSDVVRFQGMQNNYAKADRKAFMNSVRKQIKSEGLDKNSYEIESAALALWNDELERNKAKTVDPARRDALLSQLFSEVDVKSFWERDKPQWKVIANSQDKPNDAVFAAMAGMDEKTVIGKLKAKGINVPVWTNKTQTAASYFAVNGMWPADVRKAAMKQLDDWRKAGDQRAANPSQKMINDMCKYLFERGAF